MASTDQNVRDRIRALAKVLNQAKLPAGYPTFAALIALAVEHALQHAPGFNEEMFMEQCRMIWRWAEVRNRRRIG